MTVTGINIEEKVRNYEGNNDFIKGLKPGLMKYGRLTPKQFAVAEKLIIQEERQTEINVEELPTNLRAIVEYKGESKFVLDLQEKYKKYRRLTEKQVQAGYQAIDREIQKNSQKEVNIKLVGNTIKLGRNIARDIKEENNLEFHPILVDVTEIVTMSNRAMKLKAKLTKENGGICRCCGKTLTDYMSQVTGIGPVCAKYVGVEHPKTKNDVEQFKADMSKKIDEIGEFEFWIPKRQIVQWNGSASLIMKVK
jgi:CRISPR/Cas system CSM-associated protein Csm2 small subunit